MDQSGFRRETLLTIAFVAALYLASSVAGSAQRRPATNMAPATQTVCGQWFDEVTGRHVEAGPLGWSPSGGLGNNPDPNHDSFGGHNYVRLPNGTWIDAATHQPVQTGPPGWNPTGGSMFGSSNPDANHVEFGGHTFVRANCTPSPAPSSPAPSSGLSSTVLGEGPNQWLNLKTSQVVETGPPGWDPTGASTYGGRVTNPDPDHVVGQGYTFVKEKGIWVNEATQQPVRVGPVAWSPSGDGLLPGVEETDSSHILFKGEPLLRLRDCGGPLISVQGIQAYIPSTAQVPPPIQSYGWSAHDFTAGIYFGAIGRTDTYDDGYKIGGTSPFIGGSFGLNVPLNPTIFVGGQVQLLYPFTTAELDTTQTKLGTTGTFQGIFGVNVPVESHPLKIWGGFGGAMGAVQSGYSSSTSSYSDTEALKGITGSVGASIPILPQISLTTDLRYLKLFSHDFVSPGGSYSMSDSGISGSVGLEYTFK